MSGLAYLSISFTINSKDLSSVGSPPPQTTCLQFLKLPLLFKYLINSTTLYLDLFQPK